MRKSLRLKVATIASTLVIGSLGVLVASQPTTNAAPEPTPEAGSWYVRWITSSNPELTCRVFYGGFLTGDVRYPAGSVKPQYACATPNNLPW